MLGFSNRFNIPKAQIDPETQTLPVNGTREALFSFAQCIVDPSSDPLVIMPNPFYQIYEGAALLAGAKPYYLNTLENDGYLPNYDAVPDSVGSAVNFCMFALLVTRQEPPSTAAILNN